MLGMKVIDQEVPDGKTLIAGGVSFPGPCYAKAKVSMDTRLVLVNTPPIPVPLTQAAIAVREANHVLNELDSVLPRIAEDIINTLVTKEIVSELDLPEIVQQRLIDKRSARSIINQSK